MPYVAARVKSACENHETGRRINCRDGGGLSTPTAVPRSAALCSGGAKGRAALAAAAGWTAGAANAPEAVRRSRLVVDHWREAHPRLNHVARHGRLGIRRKVERHRLPRLRLSRSPLLLGISHLQTNGRHGTVAGGRSRGRFESKATPASSMAGAILYCSASSKSQCIAGVRADAPGPRIWRGLARSVRIGLLHGFRVAQIRQRVCGAGPSPFGNRRSRQKAKGRRQTRAEGPARSSMPGTSTRGVPLRGTSGALHTCRETREGNNKATGRRKILKRVSRGQRGPRKRKTRTEQRP